jgi:hypothetical protein
MMMITLIPTSVIKMKVTDSNRNEIRNYKVEDNQIPITGPPVKGKPCSHSAFQFM